MGLKILKYGFKNIGINVVVLHSGKLSFRKCGFLKF